MTRDLTGWAWGFNAFRVLCLWCVAHGVAVRWIGCNTPLLFVLHIRAIEAGDFRRAAELVSLMRSLGQSPGGMGAGAPHRGS